MSSAAAGVCSIHEPITTPSTGFIGRGPREGCTVGRLGEILELFRDRSRTLHAYFQRWYAEHREQVIARTVARVGTAPANPYLPNYWCYTDPPVGCAVFCEAVHTIAFTPACFGPASGQQFFAFRDYIIASLDAAEAQGAEICPQSDLYKYVTPCAVGFFPIELPNQDHSVCTPAPPGCPL